MANRQSIGRVIARIALPLLLVIVGAAFWTIINPAPAFARSRHALAPLPPPPPGTVWFHIVVNDGLRDVGRVERALIDQETQVATVWEVPVIRFGSAGIPVSIEPVAQTAASCLNDEAAGCHWQEPNQAIYVENFVENIASNAETRQINQNSITSALSHEVLEAMVDPDGSRPEVCDPVAWRDYKVDGITVSDWTFPSYFAAGPPPYDRLRGLRRPA